MASGRDKRGRFRTDDSGPSERLITLVLHVRRPMTPLRRHGRSVVEFFLPLRPQRFSRRDVLQERRR